MDPSRRAEVILISGHATVDSAISALRVGVLDYLTKPVDVRRLKAVLANVSRTLAFKEEVGSLREELRQLGHFGRLIGNSTPMQRVYDLVTRVAPTDATVLLVGESGTGKEEVAATIHELGRRKKLPFLPLNCGAVPPNLIESELFGHEKGSFTGATQMHRGYFERASKGTLFLDEVTEMPIELQVKLLRVLETRNVLRVGGSTPVEVDVRVIAATNKVPAEAVSEGKLREDLYYRLSVFPIALPPLRDRDEDLELLTRRFLAQLAEEHGTAKHLNQEVLARFERYGWPGNVRELKNVIERAYILADDQIEASHIPADVGVPEVELPEQSAAPPLKVGTSLADAERRLIMATLTHFAGDKRRAAETLGISLKTLYNRLNVYEASNT
jgi:DNA-binding NtrC family response regulator